MTAIASLSLLTLALLFYTLGVWSERLARDLRPRRGGASTATRSWSG